MSIEINKKDVIWGYVGTAMTLLSNLLLLPIILNKLTGGQLGLWYAFLAIGNVASLFDFGFKPTISRNIAYVWCGASDLCKVGVLPVNGSKHTNFELLNKVFKTCKRIYFIVSLAATIFLVTIGTVYIMYVKREMDYFEVIIAWSVYVIGVFLNLYFGYYSSFLVGVGAMAEMNKANVIARVLQIIISIILLYINFGILSVSMAYLLYGILYRAICKRLFYQYKNIGDSLKPFKNRTSILDIKHIFCTIWHNAWRDGVVAFSIYLTSQVSTILCSLYLSLGDTGTYGLTMQLTSAIASIATAYYSTFQPKLQAECVENDLEGSRKTLSTAIMAFLILYILGAVVLCTFGIPIIQLIKSETQIRFDILIVLSVYTLFYKNHILFASYIANTNRIVYMKAFLISGIVMTILSILLLRYTSLGIWSLIIAPMAVELVYDNWRWPQFVMKELNLSILQMIKLGLIGMKNIVKSFIM